MTAPRLEGLRVLASAGYSPERIAQLRAASAIG
jgi:hypothetical protein